MDFHSVMETFAEAWVAANTHTPLTVAAEQGLINGPNNHAPPSRTLTALPAPSHGSSEHSTTNHQLPTTNNTNGCTNNDAIINDSTTVIPLNNSPVHQVQPIPCSPQENSIEHREVEFSSEGESCNKVPDRIPTDSPSNGANFIEIKSCVSLSKPHGKSLPVHCIVEQIPGPQACGQHVELDSYAIVPCDTLFNDLVRTALAKLGYSTSQILGAKGSIQIKKWKPLAFDQITENPEATVADILGELTTVASLHVRLYSVPDDPCEWKDITVRNAVLELLREMSQSKLAKLCPLSQPMLSNIINNRYMGKIGKEKCQEFGLWYLNYRKQNPEGSTLEVVPSDRPADGRLTFHPTKELPLMRGWFHSCRNPSRRTLQLYVDILNQGPVRQQERPKVVLSTLKNWWKNEKQRERKHQREDKVDDPVKIKKRKRSDASRKSESTKNCPEATSLNSVSPQDELKSNNFTLINHSENESDTEKNDKKESCISESIDLTLNSTSSPAKSNSSEVNKSNTSMSIMSSANRNIEPHIISTVNESRLNSSAFLSPKVSSDPSIFHKIHNVCADHNQTVFPFSDPNLGVHNCTKIYCDNNSVERTNGSDENISSEDDVDTNNHRVKFYHQLN